MKPTVLICLANYLPGFKSGGPLRSILNITDHLRDEFDFKVITSDRDLGDESAYPGISIDKWSEVEGVSVHYTSPALRTAKGIARIIRSTEHDVLYLNSFFSPVFTAFPLLARRLGWIADKPLVIAPRGEFSAGALALKAWKKKPYLTLTSFLGFYSSAVWQASTKYEADDIRQALGIMAPKVLLACDLPTVFGTSAQRVTRDTTKALNLVFLSRISPMKNLSFALDCLSSVTVPVAFSIYGPAEDKSYWRVCQDKISGMPSNIKVRYHGPISPNEVQQILANNDLFFLPTLGENYGHVIAEAISAGTPALLSDKTPWRDLERKGIGLDLPLGDTKPFVTFIEEMAQLDAESYGSVRLRVSAFAAEMHSSNLDVEMNRKLFRTALGKRQLQ